MKTQVRQFHLFDEFGETTTTICGRHAIPARCDLLTQHTEMQT